METNQAEENLKVIRTIMERAALYRRRLGPIMLVPGVVGTALGVGGYFAGMVEPFTFVCSWLGAAVFTALICFLISRAQARGEGETVFSPSARRVMAAMVPALVTGAIFSFLQLPLLSGFDTQTENIGMMIAVLLFPMWMAFFGLSLQAAGQFSSRGVRILGWLFILSSSVALYVIMLRGFGGFTLNKAPVVGDALNLHLLMAITFGGYHLIAAAYLFVTEKRGSST